MKTLFLDWQEMGNIVAARDPAIKNKVWYIEPSISNHFYRLYRVTEGLPPNLETSASDPHRLQWEAVSLAIKHYNWLFGLTNAPNKEEIGRFFKENAEGEIDWAKLILDPIDHT